MNWKKYIFENDDILSFLLWVIAWFWVNILTNKLDFWICFWIISTIIWISVFIWLKIWLWKLDKFEYFINYWKWERKVFWWITTWVCEDTDEYQLVLWNNVTDNFKENWTKIFPDNENNYSCELFLKRNWIIVREFIWWYFDWGRTFLPLPERVYDENNPEKDFFYYIKDSLKYKMIYQIWDFWSETSFERLFERAKIKIITEKEKKLLKVKK